MPEIISEASGSKEGNSPLQQPLRNDLVAKAVTFLQDVKVNQTPVNYRKAFLQKKGLTDAEIDEAFRQVGTQPVMPAAVQPMQPVYQHYAVPPQPPRSTWRDYANFLVLAGGATYLTVNVVKNYILPRFFGVPTAQQQQLNNLQENLLEVQNGMKFLVDSVQQTLAVVQQQQEVSNKLLQQLTAKEDTSKNLERAVVELKNEMAVVKSLLLSRDQFPPLPATKTPSLPAWQQLNGMSETPKKRDQAYQNGVTENSNTASKEEGSPV